MGEFFRRGKTQVHHVPTIASATLAPTAAELTAGDDLSAATNDVNGFSFANQPINTPKMSSSFTSKIPGEDQSEDSSLMLYLDNAANPLRTTLAKDVEGFIVIADYKIGALAAADMVDVWPMRVAAAPKQYDMGNAPALWTAQFTITDEPAIDVAVLA